MAKKFGKILLFAAAAGSAAAAVYYYMQKKDAKTIADDEEDTDDLPMEDFDASEDSQNCVPETPKTKEEAQPQAKTDSDFTPLSQQLNQTTDTEEETVEEFFSEEDDTSAN